jgi:hypothetical protein
MNKLRVLLGLLLVMYVTSAEACRYTIREIGFSTLSKVTYVIYKINENSSFIPTQQSSSFSESNIKTFGLNLKDDTTNPIINFVKKQNLTLPTYILVDPSGRMLPLVINEANKTITETVLFSPIQKRLITELPTIYATVLLIEGTNFNENHLEKNRVLNTCKRIENIMPNMPKQVKIGPNLVVISKDNFQEEKVLLWSLGIEKIPEHPIVFVLYGKGRVMGEKIDFEGIKEDNVYKHLSIIGADCECGLDRKWMLGYQVPLNWPKEVRQGLSDNLGFDVDNPMILTEMSRILAIENKVPKDPDGVSFEPIVVNLDKEFDNIPEMEHKKVESKAGIENNNILIYSFIFFIVLVGIGAAFILKRKP